MKKIQDIIDFWNTDFSQKLIKAEHIFSEIYDSCGNTFDKGCGSYLFDGQTYEYLPDLYPKQKLLYDKAAEASNVLEIGTYMGHSALIMLLANPKLKLTTVDIASHLSAPAATVLQKYFPDADITFICENSLEVIPTLQDQYDLFHIDGNHDADFVIKEYDLCKRLSNTPEYRIVFDDWHGERGPGSTVEKHIMQSGKVTQYIVPNCLWTNAYIETEL